MDNLTHSLFGWTVARAGLGRRLPYATATLIVASNISDVDIVVGLRDGVDYLAVHRGPTHGPLGVVGLGLVTAALISVWRRIASRTAPSADDNFRNFVSWWGLAMVGIACHVLMDLPTSYGTRLLSPFVWTWYALDWMPIIDVYLWLVLIVALVVGSRSRLGRKRAALIGLALMACDYAGRALLHQRALEAGASFTAAGVHAPCVAAPTLVAHRGGTLPEATGADVCLEAAALPTFFSAFTWRIIRQHSNGYELSDRRVLGTPATIQWTWLASNIDEVERLRATRPGRVFLDFARFPLAELLARTPSLTTVRLFDARFAMTPSGSRGVPASARLSVVVTVDASGRIVDQHFGP